MGQSHFKVSGEDLFATREMKLLLSHLNVLANEHNFIAWARLLKGFGVTASNAFARNLLCEGFTKGINRRFRSRIIQKDW